MVWVILAAWSALILYVIIDVRRIMCRNNANNAKILGIQQKPITNHGVMLNRIVLLALLIVSGGAILYFGPRVLA